MMKFCSNCGNEVDYRIPEGDNRPRFICDSCRTIHYQNPKIVVGCIPEWEGRILFCRRAIEPRKGKWTLPAGYLENQETLAEGAKRETLEESMAYVDILSPYAMFNLPFIDQIYLMFRAQLKDTRFGPTPESSEVQLMTDEEIPWDDLAFNVIRKILSLYIEDRREGVYTFQMGDISRHDTG